ncbi:hypothetical protein TNCV_4922921 [Trichonephila clavipes]|nr:hypothetical protein TNCV_4922921 [Trichonephila clavipes]
MVYDSTLKKWIPSGSSSGLSKVHIYHNIENNTFRVVGRKVQDHEADGNPGATQDLLCRGLTLNMLNLGIHHVVNVGNFECEVPVQASSSFLAED